MSRLLRRLHDYAISRPWVLADPFPEAPYVREREILLSSSDWEAVRHKPKLKFRLLKRYKYTTYTCLKVDNRVFLLPIPKQKLRLPEVERCNQCGTHAVALVYVGDYNVPVCEECERRTWFSSYWVVRNEFAASESIRRASAYLLTSYYTPERLEQLQKRKGVDQTS
ncbi:hypothetical protein [Siphonobacter sp. BAB-5405]|uniref:hypothetical protein n=1 Tax=Siphonobacter sp. BAB-5405 TaxID=1864825 RepID=UPI0011AECAB3|nr:hypothetical protein [Siphonobacter sp. BAB-5405]